MTEPETHYEDFSKGRWFGIPFERASKCFRAYYRKNIRRVITLAVLSKAIQ